MRIVNQRNRLGLLTSTGVLDVEQASAGLFSADVQSIYPRWTEFRAWAADAPQRSTKPLDPDTLGAPAPKPGQVFAIGLNYRGHALETGIELPDTPMVFTKFPASVTGPVGNVELPSNSVDFEAEVVAVIGQTARHIKPEDGWNYVAGLTAGQDLSEREVQLKPPAPQQYNLGKSFAGFAPIGPILATPDEFADPDDLEVGCILSGEQMQKARTSDLIFSIPQIIAYLSAILPLSPGDLIFSGTPAGIGWSRNPRRLITKHDELVTHVEGIGEMRHHFTTAPAHR
jgi:2-keto-4-pentenoate hydratase/2-oxohepta-3-ene-1,7-dioic acid hydratase in catechol pathway